MHRSHDEQVEPSVFARGIATGILGQDDAYDVVDRLVVHGIARQPGFLDDQHLGKVASTGKATSSVRGVITSRAFSRELEHGVDQVGIVRLHLPAFCDCSTSGRSLPAVYSLLLTR
jgi:hypothetical protein